MATNSGFNLSKSTKRIASTITNRTERSIYLKAMVDAESSEQSGKSRKWSDPALTQKSRETPKG